MEGNKESLEERIERIRLRNEDIEKKHRIAEEDRIRALKDNAMVEVKSPKHEDWPKHKYDTLDFTYDVVAEKNADESSAGLSTAARKKKTFSEGGGPPPDPVYNFLADSERDGDSKTLSNAAALERKRNNEEQSSGGFRKSGSFRRQNSVQSNNSNGAERGKGYNASSGGSGNDYRKPLQFDQQPKKNLETNWRTQTRDTDKTFGTTGATTAALPLTTTSHANNNNNTKGDAPLVDDAAIAATYHQKKPVTPVVVQPPAMRPNLGGSASPSTPIARQPLPISRPAEPTTPVPKELVVEQRGNIQISVSKDGEIQSVKLNTARQATPGTGRVGLPRAITKQSQPPPAPAEILPSDVISVSPSLLTPTPLPLLLPSEAQNPNNHFHIPNMAYPPPPIATKGAGDAKKFSVQDRLAKFHGVPT